jgi:hypothetical protein
MESLWFYLHPIHDDEFLRACKRAKDKLSGSEDVHGFSPARLHHLIQSPIGRTLVTTFFNQCITDTSFPEAMKVARIVPVPKTSIPSSPSKFRPISVLPNLSKLFEKCLFSQLSDHLEENKMLSPQQSGCFSSGNREIIRGFVNGIRTDICEGLPKTTTNEDELQSSSEATITTMKGHPSAGNGGAKMSFNVAIFIIIARVIHYMTPP